MIEHRNVLFMILGVPIGSLCRGSNIQRERIFRQKQRLTFQRFTRGDDAHNKFNHKGKTRSCQT